MAGITWYQRTLSARLPTFGVSCRFVPTCSRYAHAVIGEHGLWTGTRLALGRLARCGPWTPHGTMAPPPRNAAAQRLSLPHVMPPFFRWRSFTPGSLKAPVFRRGSPAAVTVARLDTTGRRSGPPRM
ncbi:MAG: hypothetical protein DSY84_08045 [Candidatus Neomarinimicrobiota bacterium]|nr:MAG: hypothetical protein DSY84_08045 [Candidatus Neomarinimicrobiota bacterium]